MTFALVAEDSVEQLVVAVVAVAVAVAVVVLDIAVAVVEYSQEQGGQT
jgi:hypothetical protein